MLVGSDVRRVAIVGGSRIPFARSHGAYARAGNAEMLTAALQGVVSRFGLDGVRLGEVAAGAVIKHSRDFNLARECVLGTTLDPHTPAFDLQRACGTSLEAAIGIANKIALGQIDAGIAGGVDSVSDPPVVYGREYQQILLRAFRARSLGARLAPFLSLRPRHFKPMIPDASEPRTGLSMGESCELMAKRWGITRTAQDEIAFESHRHAAAAWNDGFFDDLSYPLPACNATTTFVPTVRSRNWLGCARVSIALRAARSRRAIARRSPTAHRRCCWPARTGRARAACRFSVG